MHKLLSINYLYLIPILLSAVAGIRSFMLARLKPYRLFAIYLLITMVVETMAILWKWYLYQTPWWNLPRSNIFIYCGFLPVRLAFLVLVYNLFLKDVRVKAIIRYLGILFIIFGILNYFLIQGPDNVNTYTLILTHFTAIALALLYFNQVLHEPKIMILSRTPMVWISFGTLIYYAGTLPFFLFLDYLSGKLPGLAISFLYINHGLNIIMYSFYLTAFLCKPQSQP